MTLGQCEWAPMSGLGHLIGGCSVWDPNTERARGPRSPADRGRGPHPACQLATLQGERAGGRGPRGESIQHITGSGASARYEVVEERMSEPADASYVYISSLVLSPDLQARKSNCLLPKLSLPISTQKVLLLIPQRLHPFLAQAKNCDDILDTSPLVTKASANPNCLFLYTPEFVHVTMKCHQ